MQPRLVEKSRRTGAGISRARPHAIRFLLKTRIRRNFRRGSLRGTERTNPQWFISADRAIGRLRERLPAGHRVAKSRSKLETSAFRALSRRLADRDVRIARNSAPPSMPTFPLVPRGPRRLRKEPCRGKETPSLRVSSPLARPRSAPVRNWRPSHHPSSNRPRPDRVSRTRNGAPVSPYSPERFVPGPKPRRRSPPTSSRGRRASGSCVFGLVGIPSVARLRRLRLRTVRKEGKC